MVGLGVVVPDESHHVSPEIVAPYPAHLLGQLNRLLSLLSPSQFCSACSAVYEPSPSTHAQRVDPPEYSSGLSPQ